MYLPTLTVVLLLGLSMVATAQAASMDTWEITIESDILLSADVKKGIEGAAEYIVRELILEWQECASIRCICRVMEQEGEIYRITMAIDAEHTNGEAIYVKVLFEYDAQSGGYVIKEWGPKPTTNTNPPPSRIGVGLRSKFELTKETEKGIKDAVEELVEERINVGELGVRVGVECFVLKKEGEVYTVYARVFKGPPLPLSPGTSESKPEFWEAAFKYNPTQGACEVTSFSEVDNFLVPEDMKQKAVTIGEGNEEIKAFIMENAENNLTSQADWINRHEEIVRLQYTVTLTLNETHFIYKDLTAYIDVGGEEVLHRQKHEGVWYTPTPTPEPRETGAPTTTTDAAASTPVEYYSLGIALITVAVVGTLIAIRKTKS